MSANDNILAGLAGFTGGVKDVLVPYIQLTTKAKIDEQMDINKSARELETYKAKLPLELGQQKQLKDYESQLATTRESDKFNNEAYVNYDNMPPSLRGVLNVQPGGRIRKETIAPAAGLEATKVRAAAKAAGAKAPQAVPAAQAGLFTLSSEAIDGVDKARKILFPDGTPESFDRTAATKANVPGSALPFIPNAAPFSEDGQNVNRWLGEALSAKQLIKTGVAARPDETAQMVREFMGRFSSNPKALHNALGELQNFYRNYNRTLTTRGASPTDFGQENQDDEEINSISASVFGGE